MAPEDVEEAIENPIAWLFAAVSSFLAVVGTVVFDPTGSLAAVLALIIDSSMTMFTALSISAFTVAPNIPQIPSDVETALVVSAILIGIVAVLKILASLWDRLKARVD